MNRFSIVLLLVLMSNVVQAEDNIHFTPVVTRLVKLLTEQEQALTAAIATGEREKINAFLLEDFEERTAAMPATPIPKAQWLDAKLKHASSAANAQIEQASAHEFGELVAFSFTSIDASKTNAFIVDLWKSQPHGGWKLAVRYRAPADTSQSLPDVLPKK